MLFDSYCSIIFYLYLLHYSPTDLSQYYVKISTETNIMLVATCITSVEVRKLPDFYLELKSSSVFASGESLGLKSSLFPTIIIYFIKKILPHSPAVYSRDLLQAWQCLHRSSTRLQCLPFGMQDMNSKQDTILSYISVEDYK